MRSEAYIEARGIQCLNTSGCRRCMKRCRDMRTNSGWGATGRPASRCIQREAWGYGYSLEYIGDMGDAWEAANDDAEIREMKNGRAPARLGLGAVHTAAVALGAARALRQLEDVVRREPEVLPDPVERERRHHLGDDGERVVREHEHRVPVLRERLGACALPARDDLLPAEALRMASARGRGGAGGTARVPGACSRPRATCTRRSRASRTPTTCARASASPARAHRSGRRARTWRRRRSGTSTSTPAASARSRRRRKPGRACGRSRPTRSPRPARPTRAGAPTAARARCASRCCRAGTVRAACEHGRGTDAGGSGRTRDLRVRQSCSGRRAEVEIYTL
jgi:hypothetical protein